MKIQLKKVYSIVKFESIEVIESKYKNIARVMKETGKIGSVILKKGNAMFTGHVFTDGSLTKLKKSFV